MGAKVVVQEKLKALGHVLTGLEKQFGKGAVMLLGTDGPRAEVKATSTGSMILDAELGIGGFPRGRISEIYGPEAGGKTTLALSAIAQVQAAGGLAAFIDAEHALDVKYAQRLGVDVKNLVVAQPDSGEQALEITEQLVRSAAVDIVVIDSVAALVPRAEIEGEMGDAHVGLQARLMSQALRKLTGAVSKTDTAVVFINQLRHKIGVMFGSPETTTGGNALKFYASVRIDLRRIETLKGPDGPYGARTRAKVVKNKLAPPFREAVFDIRYGEGISTEGEILDVGLDLGVIEKAGAWLSFGSQRLGQGREKARELLVGQPKLKAELVAAIDKARAAKKPTA